MFLVRVLKKHSQHTLLNGMQIKISNVTYHAVTQNSANTCDKLNTIATSIKQLVEHGACNTRIVASIPGTTRISNIYYSSLPESWVLVYGFIWEEQ
jgi:hypothetical protein